MIFIETHNAIEGFHNWPGAPEQFAFLKSRHRHIFEIRCRFEVHNKEREKEVIFQQTKIADFLYREFGNPCEFNGMSCESIAELIMNSFCDCCSVTVLEDGYGGATFTR